MQVGDVTSAVTVQGDGLAQVNTQTSEIAGTVTAKELTQLQLNGRNFTQLVTLVPGVSNQTGQDEGVVGVQGNVNYSINGGRVENNNWEVDGGDVMDNGSNETLNVYPSIEAIGEVRVLTSNYGAQYGRNASGTIEVETKSGTNQFHGSAYEFLRNEMFNAHNYFDLLGQPKAPYMTSVIRWAGQFGRITPSFSGRRIGAGRTFRRISSILFLRWRTVREISMTCAMFRSPQTALSTQTPETLFRIIKCLSSTPTDRLCCP